MEVGEQSDTLGLLRLHDRKSRHRRIKKQRGYERLTKSTQVLRLLRLTILDGPLLGPRLLLLKRGAHKFQTVSDLNNRGLGVEGFCLI